MNREEQQAAERNRVYNADMKQYLAERAKAVAAGQCVNCANDADDGYEDCRDCRRQANEFDDWKYGDNG